MCLPPFWRQWGDSWKGQARRETEEAGGIDQGEADGGEQ